MTREEQLACLEDRPCSVCKFHTDRCNRWTCVFEDEPEEQEPCEDCISRKALLEEIENGIKAGNYEEGYEEYPHINDMDDIIECIKYADSVQPKPKTGHWIPVSERLPEDFQRVLVTIVNYKGDKVVRVAEYYNRKGVFQIKENHEQWEVGEKGLLAWMPLPEPYTAESEGKK